VLVVGRSGVAQVAEQVGVAALERTLGRVDFLRVPLGDLCRARRPRRLGRAVGLGVAGDVRGITLGAVTVELHGCRRHLPTVPPNRLGRTGSRFPSECTNVLIASGVSSSTLRWRAALTAAFACNGITMATWVSRTPAIRDLTGSSTGQMGLVIAGMSMGSMVGIAIGGPYVTRSGARAAVRTGLLGIVAGTVLIAVGATLGLAWLVGFGLACIGFGMGSGEIALNVEGVTLEGVLGRTVVPSLHGAYSAALCAGALLGLAANAAQLPVLVHLLVCAAVTLGVGGWLVANLPPATGREEVRATRVPLRQTVRGSLRVWGERRTLAIGVIVLGMALAEGSAGDWLPLIVVDGFGLTATTGSLIFAFFGAAMATGRFAGGWFLDRYGRTPVMLTSAVAAVVGIGLVSFAPSIAVAAVGVLFWGVGAALGFPVALSAAGDDPVGAARRVSAVATAGYAAFLVGPPVLGFIGEHTGLRSAILVVLVMVAVSAFFARSVGKPDLAPAR
jgi:hypothetical protein